jgi:hypothetical protein
MKEKRKTYDQTTVHRCLSCKFWVVVGRGYDVALVIDGGCCLPYVHVTYILNRQLIGIKF